MPKIPLDNYNGNCDKYNHIFYRKIRLLYNNKLFWLYLILVLIIFSAVYVSLLLLGNTYIYLDIGADTYSSYWPIYAFARDYYRSFPFEGWSFQIGLGSSIVSLFPIFSDPYNIFIIPFTKINLDTGIFIAVVAKTFSLAIIAYLYLHRLGFNGLSLVLASVSYTFCGFFVGWGQHYQFATAFILFTLVLFCLEVWLNSSRWLGLVLSIALLAAYSLYFTYMTLVFLVIYYIIRYLQLYNFRLQKFIIKSFSTLGLIVIGLALAGVLFLPQLNVIIQSPRVSAHRLPQLSPATLKEYYTIVMRFFSNGLLGVNVFQGYSNYYESPFLYTGILTIFLIPRLLFSDVRKRSYIWIMIICIIALIFPTITNPIFNAFSDYTYRWTFVLVPVLIIGLAKAFSVIGNDSHSWFYLIITHLCFLPVALIFILNRPKDTGISGLTLPVSIANVLLFSIIYGVILTYLQKKIKKNQISYILLSAVVIELTINGFVSVNFRHVLTNAVKKITPYFDSTYQAVKTISEKDNSFFRINKLFDDNYLTDSLFQGFNGEKGYSSAIPGYIWEMENAFGLNGVDSNFLWGFSDRQSLRDISAVKYMFSHENNSYAGYELFKQVGEIYIYRNLNALPIGFAYDNYITYTNFQKLNASDRQYILYDAVIVPDEAKNILVSLKEALTPKLTDLQPISIIDKINPVNITIGDDLFPDHLDFTSESYDPQIYIPLQNVSDTSMSITFSADSSVNSKGKVYYQIVGSDFNENDVIDFPLKIGYQSYYLTIIATGIDALRLDIAEKPGSFSIDGFSVLARNDEGISTQASYRKSQFVNNTSFTNDDIKGTINLAQASILYFSIPYDSGWQVFIDGEPEEKIKSNFAFSGVYVNSGMHTFEWKYSIPLFIVGRAASISTFVAMMIYFIWFSRRKEH